MRAYNGMQISIVDYSVQQRASERASISGVMAQIRQEKKEGNSAFAHGVVGNPYWSPSLSLSVSLPILADIYPLAVCFFFYDVFLFFIYIFIQE